MRFLPHRVFNKKADYQAHGAIGDIRVSLRSEIKHVLDDFVSLYPPAADLDEPQLDGSPTPLSPPSPRHGESSTRRLFDLARGEANGRDGQPAIQIDVRRSGRSKLGRALYQVTADGKEIGGRYRSNGVFPLVEWGINLRIMATRREFVQVHAASMVRHGNGFVFAGDSGCGKSTLAAVLLAHGWQYLCDEFALIDINSLCLQPFPKALCIKAGSVPVIQSLGLPVARRRDYVKAFKGPVSYLNARDLGADRIGKPAPVRFVLFPTYQAGARPTLTPIARAEAATELYRCCFNKGSLPSGALPTLSQLVQGAKCFRLIVGNPAETAQLLETLCEPSATLETRADVRPQVLRPAVSRRVHRMDRIASRREILKVGVKLAYVAPCVLTLTSRQAFAAASDPSGICSTATHTGGLCETDTDCCSRQCNLGVCK